MYIEMFMAKTSHFQFLQKPSIRDVFKPLKKIENFLCGTHEIFPFIHFEITWTGRINLKFFWGYKSFDLLCVIHPQYIGFLLGLFFSLDELESKVKKDEFF
jgi:hypothetical protein